MKRFFANEKGQSLVEAAVLSPVVLLIMFGIIEVGRFEHVAIQLDNAARTGVQYGAQSQATAGDATGIDNAALGDSNMAQCSATVTTNCLTLNPTYYCVCADGTGMTANGCSTAPTCPGSVVVRYVSLSATGAYQSLFHYPGLPGSITMTRKAVQRVNS